MGATVSAATQSTQSSLAYRSDFAGQRQVDVDFFGDFEDENAGILQAPIHIGDNEVRFGCEASAVHVDLHGHGEVVGCAVQSERARDLDGGVAGGRDGAVVFLRNKRDFGIMFDVENILVHLF